MAESIASSDVVFVGTLTGRSGSMSDGYDWRFSVSEAVKGEVPAELEVHGEDFGVGCGTDFGSIRGPMVVIVEREDDGGYAAPACVPAVSADDLDGLLAPLPAPDGRGRVAALVAHPYRWSNIAALDRAGRVLSWGYVDGGVAAITHCSGSSTAAVTAWTDGGRQRLRFVDLTTMQVTDGGEIGAAVDTRGELVCIASPRGFDVVAAWDPGFDELGEVRVAASGSQQDSVSVSAASDSVMLSDGTVYVLPGRAGGGITQVRSASLRMDEQAELADREAAFVGAANETETQLAVVVSDDGADATYGREAEAIAIFEIRSDPDRSLVRAGTLPLRDSEAVEPTAVAWLDDETLAVERSTGNTKVLDVYGTGGVLISRTDIGWGWGDAVLGGSLLRSRDGGLELIAPDGTSTPLDPPPAKDTGADQPAFVKAVDDGPVIEPRRPSPPRPRPVAVANPGRAIDPDSAAQRQPESTGSVTSTSAMSIVGVLVIVVIVAGAALASAPFARRRITKRHDGSATHP